MMGYTLSNSKNGLVIRTGVLSKQKRPSLLIGDNLMVHKVATFIDDDAEELFVQHLARVVGAKVVENG